MQDKCPKCGEPLITKTIKKELGLGSIDYPIALVCPKCHWSKDLTGAGDVVPKPITMEIKKEEKPPAIAPEPPKAAPPKAVPPKVQPKPAPSAAFNKFITVVLAILVLGGLVWAFFIYPTAPEQTGAPKPAETPAVTRTSVQPTSTPVPEITPTGNSTRIKLDSRRGFIPNKQTIKPGDEIVWRNDEATTVVLVSNDGLFADQILAYDKEYRYLFKKQGTFGFNLKDKNLNGAVTVEP